MAKSRITGEEFLREAAMLREQKRLAALDKKNARLDMARAKASAQSTLAPAEAQAQARALELPAFLRPGTRRITPRSLPSYSEKMLAFHGNHILPPFFRSILTGVERNDPVFVKIAQEVYGFCQKNGVNITNNVNQNNQTGVSVGPSLDSVIRSLAEQKKRDRQVVTVDAVQQIGEGDGE